MAFRIQFPAGFSWARLVGALVGLSIPVAAGIMIAAGNGNFDRGAVTIAFLGSGAFIFAAILIVTNTSWLWFRPFGRVLDSLFHPAETLTYPPADLIRSLRERLRNRLWESVSQQLDALEKAYGRSSDLFYLRAHLAAGLSGDCKHITNAASRALSGREFDRYLALLRRDPPVVYVQSGDADA